MFCVSPADSKDPAVSAALLRFASAFAREGRVPADLALPPYPLSLPETEVRDRPRGRQGHQQPVSCPGSYSAELAYNAMDLASTFSELVAGQAHCTII